MLRNVMTLLRIKYRLQKKTHTHTQEKSIGNEKIINNGVAFEQ
jgi:hypothetical protein